MTSGQTPMDDLLMNAERELSESEQARLRLLGRQQWQQIEMLMTQRARITYSSAPPDVFRHCVTHHMDPEQRDELARSEAYQCPICGLLLKDRRTMTASAILGERARLAELWTAVENARGQRAYDSAFRRFRAGLGLPVQESA